MNLSNITILVTRPEPQGTELCQQITELGGNAISFPTIAFTPPPDTDAFAKGIAQLSEQEWLVFISPQAVRASVPAIRQSWPHLPPTVKFAAVGAGTAKALKAAGYDVALQPSNEWSSEALLEMCEFQQVTGKKIAVIRGVGGRGLLDTVLQDRGATVLAVVAYERVMPEIDIRPCLQQLKEGKIDAAVCTSFEGVSNLKTLLGGDAWPLLQKIPLIVMSERIKTLAQDLGFRTIWVTKNASVTAILELIVQRRNEL